MESAAIESAVAECIDTASRNVASAASAASSIENGERSERWLRVQRAYATVSGQWQGCDWQLLVCDRGTGIHVDCSQISPLEKPLRLALRLAAEYLKKNEPATFGFSERERTRVTAAAFSVAIRACRYSLCVASAAAQAEADAKAAVEAARSGDWSRAVCYAERASRAELEFGRTTLWEQFACAVKAEAGG